MATKNLTAERVRELLNYDPETGIFTRRSGRGTRWYAGEAVGSRQKSGYIEIGLCYQRVYAHRLAWLYMTGSWPKEQIDHKNGNRADNSFANLREATQAVNSQNQRRARSDNKAGLLGVFHRYHTKNSGERFLAMISVDGRLKRIGLFPSAEEAHAAYVEAKRRLHEGCTI